VRCARAHTPSSADKKANNNASRLSLLSCCSHFPNHLSRSPARESCTFSTTGGFLAAAAAGECFALSGKRRSPDLGEKFGVGVLRRAGWHSVISTANKFVLERNQLVDAAALTHYTHARESSLLLTSSFCRSADTRISSFSRTS
jgi:hypothetical protein